jgi:hypothetical protein
MSDRWRQYAICSAVETPHATFTEMGQIPISANLRLYCSELPVIREGVAGTESQIASAMPTASQSAAN